MVKHVRAWVVGALCAVLVALGVVLPTAPAVAAEHPLAGFDAGNIVTDEVFFDPALMSREEVTAFLELRGEKCIPSASGVPCLKDHRADTPATNLTAHCGPLPARTGNSAAGIIHEVATACGINPQMLILLIQRESGLITGSGERLTSTAYARATGAGCPDYLGCSDATATFFWQVYSAAERFQIYRADPDRFNHKAGVVNKVWYHPEERCGKADVLIRNQATAGLYNYTPYVPNRASLDSYPREGDLCSSYGQRNFSFYLRTWFPASAPATAGAVGYPAPASTITKDMAAIHARMADLGLARTGPSTWMILPGTNGRYYKTFGKLSIVWTPTRGATLSHQVPRQTEPPLLPLFKDVKPDTPFADAMEWMRAARVSTGYPDGTYHPVEAVERNSMAAFLYRAAGQPAFTPPSRPSFTDVPVGAPFYQEVEWLRAVGWAKGHADGTYRPHDHMNRDAMAAFLYRAAGEPAFVAPERARFTDVPVGTQFRKEIEWLASTGITTGWPDGTFQPVTPVNRDAMAAFLYRRAGAS